MLWSEEYPSYYRARYYDPQAGRFSNEDLVRFVGGTNFYSYVRNAPITRRDPLGLWQATVGGGLGLGGMLTIGHNSGQWKWGLYTGLGDGGFFDYNPKDSGGCRKFGAAGEMKSHGGIGLGGYVELDSTLSAANGPSLEVNANVPGVGGVSWSPFEPGEPPNGVIGVGEGAFAGGGFNYSSPPTQCGCE